MSGLFINPSLPLTSVNMSCIGDHPTGSINVNMQPANQCPRKSHLILQVSRLYPTIRWPRHFGKHRVFPLYFCNMAEKWELAPSPTEEGRLI